MKVTTGIKCKECGKSITPVKVFKEKQFCNSRCEKNYFNKETVELKEFFRNFRNCEYLVVEIDGIKSICSTVEAGMVWYGYSKVKELIKYISIRTYL